MHQSMERLPADHGMTGDTSTSTRLLATAFTTNEPLCSLPTSMSSVSHLDGHAKDLHDARVLALAQQRHLAPDGGAVQLGHQLKHLQERGWDGGIGAQSTAGMAASAHKARLGWRHRRTTHACCHLRWQVGVGECVLNKRPVHAGRQCMQRWRHQEAQQQEQQQQQQQRRP
jgi:hypothetical protein